MAKNGVSPDTIELVVANEDGVRILRSSAHCRREAEGGEER